jgi:hypothetical protein
VKVGVNCICMVAMAVGVTVGVKIGMRIFVGNVSVFLYSQTLVLERRFNHLTSRFLAICLLWLAPRGRLRRMWVI